MIYVTLGYSGHALMWFNRTPFRQPYPELVAAPFASGEVPPVIVVFADGWTTYGSGHGERGPPPWLTLKWPLSRWVGAARSSR